MSKDLHSVNVMVDEGQKFIDRMPEDLRNDSVATTWGGLTWGLLRAIAECPNCPGHFRTPLKNQPENDHWRYWGCSNCGHVWEWKTPEEVAAAKAKDKPKRKKGKKP